MWSSLLAGRRVDDGVRQAGRGLHELAGDEHRVVRDHRLRLLDQRILRAPSASAQPRGPPERKTERRRKSGSQREGEDVFPGTRTAAMLVVEPVDEATMWRAVKDRRALGAICSCGLW